MPETWMKEGHSIRPIDPIGVEIRGIDLASSCSDATFETLRSAVLDHGLVLLRNQHLSLDQHVALGRRFGEPEGQEVTASSPHPDVIMVSNVDPDGSIQPMTSPAMRTRAAVNRVWHTDSSFRTCPASLSIMNAVVVPPSGGATLFASMRRAWIDLDEAFRSELRGLRALHDYAEGFRRAGQAIPPEAGGSIEPVPHPIVRVHPETGDTSLYISGLAYEVEGMDREAGRVLIKRILDWCTRDEVVYRHRWQERDLVFWDNRVMLHRAEGFDGRHGRMLHHVRISGDAPIPEVHG